jgi:hypothetical protein
MYIATRCIVRARNRRQTLREASGYVVARRIAHRGKDGASLRENSAKLSVTLTSLPLEKKVASLYRATIYLAFDEGGENLREASAYQLHVRGAGQSVISPEPCAKLQGRIDFATAAIVLYRRSLARSFGESSSRLLRMAIVLYRRSLARSFGASSSRLLRMAIASHRRKLARSFREYGFAAATHHAIASSRPLGNVRADAHRRFAPRCRQTRRWDPATAIAPPCRTIAHPTSASRDP